MAPPPNQITPFFCITIACSVYSKVVCNELKSNCNFKWELLQKKCEMIWEGLCNRIYFCNFFPSLSFNQLRFNVDSVQITSVITSLSSGLSCLEASASRCIVQRILWTFGETRLISSCSPPRFPAIAWAPSVQLPTQSSHLRSVSFK